MREALREIFGGGVGALELKNIRQSMIFDINGKNYASGNNPNLIWECFRMNKN